MDIVVKAPKIITLDPRLYEFRSTKLLPFKIRSNATVKDDLKAFEGHYTKHGMLIGIKDIKYITNDIFNYLDFNASTSAVAWANAYVFKPRIGDIIPYCTKLEQKETTTSYVALIHKNGNSYIGIVIENAGIELKSDQHIWAQIVNVDPKMGTNYFIARGRVFDMWDIPFEKRYIGFQTNVDKAKSPFKLTFSNDGKYNAREILGFDEKRNNNIIKIADFLEKEGGIWDKLFRHIVNPYELVKTRQGYQKLITQYIRDDITYNEEVISRAYFKIIEITKLFELKIQSTDDLIFCIADAPGGFTLALKRTYPKNLIVTTSLNQPGQIIYDPLIKNDKTIKIDFLKDESGDLTKTDNIKWLHGKYGGKVFLISADGAFDSTAFKDIHRETLHMQLLFCEMVAALGMQKKGGHFTVKLYRRYTNETMGLIWWMAQFYQQFIIYKPMSVRMGNTEVFAIFKTFKGVDEEHLQAALNIIQSMEDEAKKKQSVPFINTLFEDNFLPDTIAQPIGAFNSYLDNVRLYCLEMALIMYLNGREKNEWIFERIANNQVAFKKKYIEFFIK